MATATNTTLGEIVLGGDLTGTADSPELVSTGVIPGVYAPVQRMYVDAKGRVVAIGKTTPAEIAGYVDEATHSTRGVVAVGQNINVSSAVISVNDASSSVLGVFTVQAPLVATDGTVTLDSASLPTATTSVKGLVQIGSGLSVTSGLLSVSIPDATTSSKGLVQIGTGLSISGGVLSATLATVGTPGVFSYDSNFQNATGTIALRQATSSVTGLLSVGTGLSATGGVVSADIPDATTSSKGLVQIGTGLSVSGGLLSTNYPVTTTSSLGIMQVGSGLAVTTGVVSVNLPDATTSSKGIAQVGSGLSVSGGDVSLNLPDATTGIKGIVQIGTGLTVTSGVVSADSLPDATTSTKGIMQVAVNGGLSVSGGIVSSALATTTTKGIVQPGTDISISGNNISLTPPDATTTTKGIVQLSTDFDVTTGIIGLKLASGSTTAGIVKPANSNLTITAGSVNVGSVIPKLDTAQTYSKSQAATIVTETYAASYSPDFSLSNSFTITLTGNITLNDSTNGVQGGVYSLILVQDGTGGRTLTISGSGYKTNQTITLSTGANKRDVVTFIYKSSTEVFVLFAPGF